MESIRRDRLPAALMAAALCGLGVWLLIKTPVDSSFDLLFPGIGCILAGMALLGWVLRDIPPLQSVASVTPDHLLKPPVLVLSGVLVSLALSAAIDQPVTTRLSSWLQLVVWALSITLVVAGLLRAAGWRLPTWQSIWKAIRPYRNEIIAVSAVLALACVLRVINLEAYPYAFANDEGWVGLEGLRIMSGDRLGLFTVGWSSQPVLSFLPDAILVGIFGHTITAVRLYSALAGTATVLGLYLLVREAGNRQVALIAATILACLAPHIHFSRAAFHNILPGFFAVWLFYLTLRALRTNRISSAVWVGLITGLAMYTYLGSRLAMVLAASVYVIGCMGQPGGLRLRWQQLLSAALVGLVVILPLAAYFMQHPDHFSARLTAESITRDPQFHYAVGSFLLRQAARTVLVFIAWPATYGFYHASQPYFALPGAALMLLGMGWSLAHLRRKPMLILTLWWWSALVLAGILTASPPASQRLVIALPAAAWFAALGIHGLWQLLSSAGFKRIFANLLAGGLTLLVAVQGVYFYMVTYPAQGGYGDRSNELIVESSRLAKQLGPQYTLLLYGGGYVQTDFASFPYLLDGYQLVQGDASTNLDELKPANGNGLLVIAVPEDANLLDYLQSNLPGGTTRTVYRRAYPDQILFSAYWLAPP